jgi:hypothetical protein
MRGKGNLLILVGILFVVAGIVGLVHPQWQGRDKMIEVDVGGRQLEVTTRRITDIPPAFCIAVIVAGLCTAGLGGINRAKATAGKSQ